MGVLSPLTAKVHKHTDCGARGYSNMFFYNPSWEITGLVVGSDGSWCLLSDQ